MSAKVRVVLEPEGVEFGSRLIESPVPYRAKCRLAKYRDPLVLQPRIADLPACSTANPEVIV